MSNSITFSVFTKAWKQLTIKELAKFISGLGFDGIEFPLRHGYQIEPKNAEKGLPKLVKQMEDYGVKVTSVASNTDENVFAGCATACIPIIRIMGNINIKLGYMASEEKIKRQIDQVLPLCEKYGVQIGVQHHFGPMISNSMELYHLIESYDSKYVAGIWDSAHSALAGEEPEQGLDILWSNLCMVNFKNAYYKRVTGPEAEVVKWEIYLTIGRQGLASWLRIAGILKERKYKGVICLSGEYTDEEQVNRLISEDIAYAKSLF